MSCQSCTGIAEMRPRLIQVWDPRKEWTVAPVARLFPPPLPRRILAYLLLYACMRLRFCGTIILLCPHGACVCLTGRVSRGVAHETPAE